MASLLSPGVISREIDLTTATPAVASTEGGIALDSKWGPAEKLVLVTDEVDLVDVFGKPDSSNAPRWFTAKNFLSYSGALYVSRAISSSSKNSVEKTNGTEGLLIKNEDHFESLNIPTNAGKYAARYSGSIGNSLKVVVVDSSVFAASDYKDNFLSEPDKDELHLLVLDEGGLFSGVKGTVLEKFEFVSKFGDAKNEDGTSNYYKKVVNDSSEYIYVLDTEKASFGADTSAWVEFDSSTGLVSMVGAQQESEILLNGDGSTHADFVYEMWQGVDGTIQDSDLVTALDEFVDEELVDISFLLSGDGGAAIVNKVFDIVSSRQDCLGVISPQLSDVVNNADPMSAIKTYRNSLSVGGLKDLKGSFMVMDDNWKYQFDKYNNVNRWVPCNGDTAGLMAETDIERAAWFSPGGRGLKNVIKLAWKSKKAERDVLYPLGVNSIATFPGEGAVLYGDRTMLKRPSAFDRINVRRLFIVLRKTISRTARSFLFENNTPYTRERFKSTIVPFLEEVQGRQGITDFLVVCDGTNNTGQVIDQNRFIGDIYIKPSRSINFIELNFVAVRTDVEFNEVVGSV